MRKAKNQIHKMRAQTGFYRYHGDRFTDPELKGQVCAAVRRSTGKCIRGKNGNMLVKFRSGRVAVVLARQLRKIVND